MLWNKRIGCRENDLLWYEKKDVGEVAELVMVIELL